MNNNQMNFDPMTGQPINQNTNTVNNNVVPNLGEQNDISQVTPTQQVPTIEPVENIQAVPTVESTQEVQPAGINSTLNTQQQMQNIPTVEQSKQEFINNTQANNQIKKEEKKDGPNIVFIVILFIIIFAAIFFLFPYLLEVL